MHSCSSRLEENLSSGNSSGSLCNFTISQYACATVSFGNWFGHIVWCRWMNFLFHCDVIWVISFCSCSCILFFKAGAGLSADNLVTLLKCHLVRQKMYSTETWKLLFQKAAPVLDQALLEYSSAVCTCCLAVVQKCCQWGQT